MKNRINKLLIISIAANLLFGAIVIYWYYHPRRDVTAVHLLPYEQYRAAIFRNLPLNDTSIAFLGDSHFNRFEPAELFKTMRAKNRGINGITSERLAAGLDSIIVGCPGQLFIELGTNDLFSKVPVSEIADNFKTILSQIKDHCPSTKIYLLSTILNRFDYKEGEMLNKQLVSLAGEYSATFIDVNPTFFDNGLKQIYDTGDGIHLNGAGYVKLCEILRPHLNL